MGEHQLSLAVLPSCFAVSRLGADEDIPKWALSGNFSSVTRTPGELSVVCPQELVPEAIEAVKDWKSLRVEGKLSFTLVGILASLTSCLAQVGISIFAISTYDTDYLFVRERDLSRAVAALRRSGHNVS
jgi:hypothetical protein